MGAAANWLDEIIVVNESKDEHRPGDVSLYRSEGDACEALEHWWVKNREGHAFSASGIRLVLDVEPSGRVVIARREECPDGPELVLAWLQALAACALEARKRVAQNGRAVLSRAEEEDVLPTTVEGLLAYIGLPWVSPRDWFVPGCLLLLATIVALLVAVLINVL